MIRSLVVPLAAFTLLLASGCSDAETPAHYDGGPLPETPDGGPDLSNRDKPCPAGGCGASELVCVDSDRNTSTTDDQFCRLRCEPDETEDPCGGEGSRCQVLEDDSHACLPANGVDAPCPCDDGLVCVGRDPEPDICKVACDPGADAGVSPCDDDETCVAFNAGTGGACVD